MVARLRLYRQPFTPRPAGYYRPHIAGGPRVRGADQEALLPGLNPENTVSLAPSTPSTRNANSEGLVAWSSAFS